MSQRRQPTNIIDLPAVHLTAARAVLAEGGAAGAHRAPATRGARPATLHYTAQFAALLGSESAAAEIARIKSPGFAASLSNGPSGRHRSAAIGTALACILVAGSVAVLWQFNDTARAPGFAGTLVIADSGGGKPPDARSASFDIETGTVDPRPQAMADGPAGDRAAPAPADAMPSSRLLQAAIDAAPFRPSILGIATAALPVEPDAVESASGGGPATTDSPAASALDLDAVADLSAPPQDPPASGAQSSLLSAMQGGGLPPRNGDADNPSDNGGHREAERSNYLADFARQAFRTTAAVDPVARSLKPDSAEPSDADSNLADAGNAADGSSKADSDPSASGVGPQASSGSGDIGDSADDGSDADGAPSNGNGRGAAAGSSQRSGSPAGKAQSAVSGASGQAQGGPAAGDQREVPGQQGKAKDAHARNDGGGTAGPDGGEGDGGSDAGPAGKGSGDPGGGDPGGAGKGGGKEHGGKGNGGKGHGGKGGG